MSCSPQQSGKIYIYPVKSKNSNCLQSQKAVTTYKAKSNNYLQSQKAVSAYKAKSQ